MKNPRPGRILLKLSGELIAGTQRFGIDPKTVNRVCAEINEVSQMSVQIGVVIGGGNIFRGMKAKQNGLDRVNADYMGMLATIINSIALQSVFSRENVQTRLMSSIRMDQVAEPYIQKRAIHHLKKGRIVIFGGGTGNPYFSTDTCSALRAAEINADMIVKATRVDGVFDSDPETSPHAKKYNTLTFSEAVNQGLKIMDSTAFTMCRENNIPIRVFNFTKPNSLKDAIINQSIGTLIQKKGA